MRPVAAGRLVQDVVGDSIGVGRISLCADPTGEQRRHAGVAGGTGRDVRGADKLGGRGQVGLRSGVESLEGESSYASSRSDHRE